MSSTFSSFAAAVDAVDIHWAGNVVEKIALPGVDCIYTVEQGKGVTGQLCGKGAANRKAGVAK
jgi:hypothetical protein